MRFIRLRTPDNPIDAQVFAHAKPAVEAVFRIATWCVLLAGLRYFSKKSGSDYLAVAEGVLFGFLWLYIFSWLTSTIEFDVIPRARRTRWWQHLVDLGVNVVLACGLFFGLQKVIFKSVEAVAAAQGIQ